MKERLFKLSIVDSCEHLDRRHLHSIEAVDEKEVVPYEAHDAHEKISSGVNSEAYRLGWERIFGSEKAAN